MNFINTSPGMGIQSALPQTVGSLDGDSMSIIRQYLRVALRWRYVILGAVAACLILGLIITLLMTPKYTATSTIEISRESSQVTNFQGVERETSIADQEFYQTQYGLLRSRTLTERRSGCGSLS
jgi:polysaccharide biosynthesis transport protein